MSAEEWRPVVGAPGYEVSNLGRVRSWRPRYGPVPRILKPGRNPKGYYMVSLQLPDRGQTTQRVHRLVTEAFVGPRPPHLQTRHLDGDQANNAVTNLAYGTQSENEADKVRHGTNRRRRLASQAA